jgi:lipopolysaccharide exporter
LSAPSANLQQSAAAGLAWNYVGIAVRSLSGLLIGIVLARLLGPKPFGVIAIAFLIAGFANLIADFGFNLALVQREGLQEEDIGFSFTFQLLVGCVLGASCIALARPLAGFFREPSATPVIRSLAITFPIQAIGQTANALLTRQFAFRTIQVVQISANLVGYLVLGIPMAWLGYGVWALVFAQITSTVLNSALLFAFAPHSIVPVLRCKNRSLFAFGIKVIGSNLSNYSIYNLDNAVVGHAFGAIPLGLYSRAFNLVAMPMNSVVLAYQNVLYSTCSRVQTQPHTLRKSYLSSLSIIGLVLIPPFAAVAVVPFTVMVGIYGQRWVDASPLLPPLALSMPLHGLLSIGASMLGAMGRPGRELRVQFSSAMLAVVLFVLASKVSVVALAWSVLAVYAFRFLGIAVEIVRALGIRLSDFWAALRGCLALGFCEMVLVRVTDVSISGWATPEALRLAVDGSVAITLFLAAFAITPRRVLSHDAFQLAHSMSSRLPNRLRQVIPQLRVTES